VALGYGNGGEQFSCWIPGAPAALCASSWRNAAGHGPVSATSSYIPQNDNRWHYVVGVCDESRRSTCISIWNGVLTATGNMDGGQRTVEFVPPIDPSARAEVRPTIIPSTMIFQFIGKIDEVAIYDRALSGAGGAEPLLGVGLSRRSSPRLKPRKSYDQPRRRRWVFHGHRSRDKAP